MVSFTEPSESPEVTARQTASAESVSSGLCDVKGSPAAEVGLKGEAMDRGSTVETNTRGMEPPIPGQTPAVTVTSDPKRPSEEQSAVAVNNGKEPPSAPAATGRKDTESSPEPLFAATLAKGAQLDSVSEARERLISKEPDNKQSDPQTEALQKETSFFQPFWSAKFFGTAIGAILMLWSLAWMYLGAFWNPMVRLKSCFSSYEHVVLVHVVMNHTFISCSPTIVLPSDPIKQQALVPETHSAHTLPTLPS